ncbi:MAG: cytochrome d ubiquinol oxidase subunit II [Bacillota bacterium]
MTLALLQSIWFLLVFVLLIGYAILDGFDLGVGILHPFARSEHERRVSLNAIGPVWDGNEVWLLTAGGALFAAFPPVYATVFSGFYIALMLLLVALIARAVAMEFRSKIESPAWKRFWDFAFFLGSALPALLLGVAFGNILRGVPIDATGQFTGSFLELLNPYALLVGALSLTTFAMHGALYLAGKSDGDLRHRLMGLVPKLWFLFAILYVATSLATIWVSPFLMNRFLATPWMWPLLLIAIVAGLSVVVFARSARLASAFAASSLAIGSMLGLAGASLYPRWVPSLTNLNYSLTIANSSSTQHTLLVMLIIALIGVPMVLAYTAFVYRIFKGKVILSEESY